MSSVRTGPCDWPLVDEIGCSALQDIEPELADAIVETATSLLWNWTGRVFGLCDLVVRPCKENCDPSTYYGLSGIPSSLWSNAPFLPVLYNGQFYNVSCSRKCRRRCTCSSTSEIGLPGPVDSIVSVEIDGVILPSSSYMVDNRHFLVRIDGEQWPTCQDMGLPPGSDGTFTVEYRWGTPVPKGGQVAASVLACEMAKATLGRECELPQRIQSITRQGVTMALVDSFEGLELGRTGIWMVDSWVTSVMNSRRRSRVLSPDTAPLRVRTDNQ